MVGDANASIPTPQPVMSRAMFGATVAGDLSVAWVAPVALEDGLAERLAVRRALAPVGDTRRITKAHMVENDATPVIEVDPRTFAVRIDGVLVEEDPVSVLPLAQRYQLF